MTTTIETGSLDKALRALKLSGMPATIDARLARARCGELGHIEFPQVLCADEISRRETMSMTRRLRKAASRNNPPWRASASPRPRSCPPPRSATSPRCAGCTPGSR
jgi:hypothetical protein